MSKSTGFLIFIFGAAIGALSAWKITKNKYEAIAQEEIDSVKKAYSQISSEAKERAAKAETEKKYSQIINSEGYIARTSVTESLKSEDDAKINVNENSYPVNPYIITPDEFAENYEYDTIDITYFSDGVLADENDEPLEDIENTIGLDAVKHFGEYEPDTVYVRNERLKCDYEIIRDERKYSEVKHSH